MNAFYSELVSQLQALTEGVPYLTANLANAAALLWQTLPDINWAGFYQLHKNQLILGPFQGKPACIQIPVGKGVCGRAVAENRLQRVENVHNFPGHIACDSASNSEIVLPLYCRGKIWGVLDIDSPSLNRFSSEDEAGLAAVSRVISEMISGIA